MSEEVAFKRREGSDDPLDRKWVTEPRIWVVEYFSPSAGQWIPTRIWDRELPTYYPGPYAVDGVYFTEKRAEVAIEHHNRRFPNNPLKYRAVPYDRQNER